MLSVGVAPVACLLASGDLRALATATHARMPLLPNVPTAAEAGLPGFGSTTWFGMVAPAKTPRPIVERLNALMREWVTDPRSQERFDKAFLLPMSMSADQFTTRVADEAQRWQTIVRGSGVRLN